MAKMFYTLDETAQTLGVSADAIKELAASGKLQQFRDRDKLMFKRDQVDGLVGKVGAAGPSGDSGRIDLSDSSPGGIRKDDPRSLTGTGVNVFEADEVEPADPMAQTQITKGHAPPEEGELTLESVGSGSGLLDLTRESDDTSLGAELLDEIYPAEGSMAGESKAGGTGAGIPGASLAGHTGVLESVLGGEEAAGASTGLSGGEEIPPTAMPMNLGAPQETYDPAASGMSLGFLTGATIALIALMLILANSLMGVPATLVGTIGASMGTLAIYAGGLIAFSVILGVLGFVIGKARA